MIVLVIFTLHICGYYFGLLFNYTFMCYCLNIFPIQDISFQVLNDVSDIEHFTHYERIIVATIHSHSASVFGHFYAMSSQSIKLVMVQQIRPLCVGNSFAFHLPMLLAALSQFIIMRMKKKHCMNGMLHLCGRELELCHSIYQAFSMKQWPFLRQHDVIKSELHAVTINLALLRRAQLIYASFSRKNRIVIPYMYSILRTVFMINSLSVHHDNF